MNFLARTMGTVLAYSLLHPKRRKPHRSPSDFAVEIWDRKTVPTSDGKKLSCWLLHGEPQKLAVVGHGIGLSKSASLGQAAYLNSQGFTVLMFDHRNHGESSLDFNAMDMARRFTLDVESCVSWLRTNAGEPDAKMVVFGYSFSTFPSVYSASRGLVDIDAVVCDSGPGLTLESLFQGFMKAGKFPRIPGFTSPSSEAALKESTAAAAVKMLGATWPPPPNAGLMSTIPMMFISGASDVVIEPQEVQALADHYPNVQVAVLEGAHLGAFKESKDAYRQTLSQFLQAVNA
ncbi:alpha/beta hydrolase [Arthrobacter roseus]|uniref:alpha/beta hydrolase n=1 Tax=Arthrobacter roseus TaxID=136274 RepID=UPI0019639C73|nr:alpha/beta fold hydrolase [Arthrobacter roseus]MBM7847890.1 pimeloyl-ACP methyl ester carboxylesterase [Arthrobacter roseus]